MSFGIKNLDNGFEYSGTSLGGLFAQKKNCFNLQFLKMLKDITKFNKQSIQIIESAKKFNKQSLIDFIRELNLGDYFKNYYLLPMAGAIWSCPLSVIKNYPAKTFLQFFYNHGLLTITKQPQWYTVKSGSQEYIKKIAAYFHDKIKLNCTITKSKQLDKKIILTDNKNKEYKFDHVIFASHTDQTYQIITDKTPAEIKILANIKYSKNIAILHKDKKQMPFSKKAWASWVYLSSKKENKVSLSYWMNNLQNIDNKYPLFVTLNPIEKITEKDIFGRYEYEHPIFDNKAIESQENLDTIQGKRNIWFCGAWTRYGFHEDGLVSAMNIAKKFNVEVPWKKC